MATINEQIADIQAEIDKTQKNKATEHHVGKLKAKIAALKAKQEKAAAHAKSSGPAKGFEVKKSEHFLRWSNFLKMSWNFKK